MTVYYNEIDKYAAQWLRNLIAAGHIAPGVVDERSIEDVRPDELAGYEQCHFFAGIAGWPLALRIVRLASVPGIWTGSPPCQDNSVAAAIHGGRAGLSGERSGLAHTWLDLIAARKPQGICFENVPGISPWLAEITSRLGQLGYRVRRPEPPAPFCDPRAAPPGDVFITSAGRTRPLDDGLPSRVGAVHAYGNAIDPWAAAEALRSLI